MDETLADDLKRTLYEELLGIHPAERPGRIWIMTQEWWNDVRRLTDSSSMPLVSPAQRGYPLGYPVEIREDAQGIHLLGYPVEIREDAQGIHLVRPDHHTERSTS